MKLIYDKTTHSLYMDLRAVPGVDSLEAVDGVVLDLDGEGRLVGIDVQRASAVLDLSTFETQSLPTSATTTA